MLFRFNSGFWFTPYYKHNLYFNHELHLDENVQKPTPISLKQNVSSIPLKKGPTLTQVYNVDTFWCPLYMLSNVGQRETLLYESWVSTYMYYLSSQFTMNSCGTNASSNTSCQRYCYLKMNSNECNFLSCELHTFGSVTSVAHRTFVWYQNYATHNSKNYVRLPSPLHLRHAKYICTVRLITTFLFVIWIFGLHFWMQIWNILKRKLYVQFRLIMKI